MPSKNPILAPTGRMKAFEENPEGGTLPASCTIFKLRDSKLKSFQDLFYFVQKALITAAGVNVHLDGFDTSTWPKENIGALSRSTDWYEGTHIQDSMDWDLLDNGVLSIMETSFWVLESLLSGRNAVVNLENLRPEGTISSHGQISSGPDSFYKIFQAVETLAKQQTIESLLALLSTFNSVIRRGGVYKNGAVTASLPIWNPHFYEYLEADPVTVHPWLKKGAVIPSDWMKYPSEIYQTFDAVNKGQLWLEKSISALDNVTWLSSDSEDPRLGHNVCREVLLESLGTCILLPLNYGQAKDPQDLIKAYVEGMELLCKFQKADHQSRAGIYLSAEIDKQVGLGIFGLANLLALEGITYANFTEIFKRQLNHLKARGVDGKGTRLQDYFKMGYRLPVDSGGGPSVHIYQWVNAIILGHTQASQVAESYGMKRAFAIAPTANVSYRNFDREGNRCTPEIAPPLGKVTERLSDTIEEKEYFNYGNVEVAKDIPYEVHFDLANCFQTLMDLTGLGHSISFNIWEPIDFDFMQKWSKSSLKATYYLLDVNQDFVDKSDQVKSCGLDGSGCG